MRMKNIIPTYERISNVSDNIIPLSMDEPTNPLDIYDFFAERCVADHLSRASLR